MDQNIDIDTNQNITDIYKKTKIKLSVRATNILEQIEYKFNNDLHKLALLIISNQVDFLSTRNCGLKTKQELMAFAREINRQITQFETNNNSKNIIGDSKSEIDALAEYFLILKNSISIRGQNILSTLENNDNSENPNLITSIINEEIDFVKTRNCGKKTLEELQKLGIKLRHFYQHNKSEDWKTNAIQLKISRIFPSIPDQVIQQAILNPETYNIPILLGSAIFFNDFHESKMNVVRFLFNTENKLDLEDIADKINLSRERVRQIINEVLNNDITIIHSKIIQELSNYKSSIIHSETNLFFETEPIQFEYLKTKYSANNKLSHSIYNSILNTDFYNCLNLYNTIDSAYQVLSKNSLERFFIFKKHSDSITFIDFAKWIEEQLYNFEKYNIEFDMEVLIQRFFQTSMTSDFGFTKQLSIFISKNKIDFLGSSERRRGEKEMKIMKISNLCFEHIEQSNNPVKTIELLEIIRLNGIDIEKNELLKLLNIHRDRFSAFGHGNWALSSWRSDGLIGGSIRDIVSSLLNNQSTPLHVSQILDYLSKFKPISARSLLTNLKTANNGALIFFNCNYIGLQSKNYDSHWHQLPKINARHFGEDMLNNAMKISTNIAEYYLKKYNYPVLNTEFLLKSKKTHK
jgi:hypothetical protein